MEGTEQYMAILEVFFFPYISRMDTAYIGEYLHFRYLKCLVMVYKLILIYLLLPNTELPMILSNRKFGYRVADSVFLTFTGSV